MQNSNVVSKILGSEKENKKDYELCSLMITIYIFGKQEDDRQRTWKCITSYKDYYKIWASFGIVPVKIRAKLDHLNLIKLPTIVPTHGQATCTM